MIVSDAIRETGTDVFGYLSRDADVPVVTTAACQGDVSVLRVTTTPAATELLPTAGVAVVRSETGGNTHSLHGVGPVRWDAASGRRGDESLVLGTLTVPDDSTAVLAHPEHGFLEIAPGTYRVGRQREWAGQWRVVAD
jgi:hypothetical protein